MLCKPFEVQEESNLKLVKEMKSLVKSLKDRVEEESKQEEKNQFVGRVDPNKQLKVEAEELENIKRLVSEINPKNNFSITSLVDFNLVA